MKFLKNKIVIILVIIILIALLLFISYKLFFDKEEILNQDTFFLACIGEENGIEEVEHLFLIDISNSSSIQIIMIPASLQVDLPGLSKMGFGELYPFGGNSIILEAFSAKFGLNIGHYFTADAEYIDELIKANSPITLNFDDDISINDYKFVAGENILEEDAVLSFIRYDYNNNYAKDFLGNKAYIISEILDLARTGKMKLLDTSSNHLRTTNLGNSFIDDINTIFTDSSSEVYFYLMDLEPDSRDIAELKGMVLAGNYQTSRPVEITRFYPIVIEKEPEEEFEEDIEEVVIEEIKKEDLIIQTLNGNYIPGSATATADKVQELGYTVVEVGNVEEGTTYDNTYIYYKESLEQFAFEIAVHLGIGPEYIQVFEDGEEGDVDIIIIVGLDFGEE